MKKNIFISGLAVATAVVSAIFCPCCKDTKGECAKAFSLPTVTSVAASVHNDLNITSKSAMLLETNSGKVLYSKDENKRLPIASMVKITTLALIYDELASGNLNMTDKIAVSETASGMGGSQAFLDFNSEYTVEDLIKSIIIASANDSCVAMAEHIAGSESQFVNRMNELAKKLGMENTKYANCTGLPAPESYSCASDVAKVYQYLMKNPFYLYKSADGNHINKIWMYDLTHPSGRVTGLTNTNKHVRFYNDCIGGKTGFTSEAGHCITVAANRGEMKPLAVIIGAPDSTTRFDESKALLNHVFNGYENRLLVDKNQDLGMVEVKRGANDKIVARAKDNYYDLVKKGETNPIAVSTTLCKSAKAPLTSDTVIGKIVVTNDDGSIAREIDVVPANPVRKMNYYDALKKVSNSYKI